jgi:hypothetical protein
MFSFHFGREYLIKKGAIITLQAGVRGWKVRKEIQGQNKAAITIQSAYKGYVVLPVK